jgi:DNA invertase Pin-like site-specific DNA recombinase
MLAVLGGLAEFERELIRARTDDGRKRAKAPQASKGAWREIWAPAEAGRAPTERSHPATR